MTTEIAETEGAAVEEAVVELSEATAAKKCWACGCLHGGLASIERAFPEAKRPAALDAAVQAARSYLVEVQYDCLGCEVCYPAVAINTLNHLRGDDQIEVGACPTAPVETWEGWPPLPGSYTVLRYSAPVSVCTLTDEKLAAALAEQAEPSLSVVGTLQTENLGIERLVQNVLANPSIRFLLVCGTDSRQAVGHLPGQSLLALSRSGIDERFRIIGAAGKRPVLRNISPEAVKHFRRTVEVVDLIGQESASHILKMARDCATRNLGPAPAFASTTVVTPTQGYLPDRMVSDPAGYFVIYPDRPRQLLSLEHYTNEGVLNAVIEGRTAPELYMTAIDKGIISRLDHAAYLGHELARAEQALASGQTFVQDAAPENSSDSHTGTTCGVGSSTLHGKLTDC
ncbi:MAG TPA: DUF4346 domain-containing protein, partial [Candidatus Methylomirabilis sp.]|nr:DUF4346 domain-containing protein [Candidatus Methylomirabilis sp.]